MMTTLIFDTTSKSTSSLSSSSSSSTTTTTMVPMLSLTSQSSSSILMQQQQHRHQQQQLHPLQTSPQTATATVSSKHHLHLLVASSQQQQNYIHLPNTQNLLRIKLDNQSKTQQQQNLPMSSTIQVVGGHHNLAITTPTTSTNSIQTSSVNNSNRLNVVKEEEEDGEDNDKDNDLEMKKKMLTDGDNNNSKPIRKDDDQSNRISNGKLKSTTGTPIINNSFKEYISEATKNKIADIIADIGKFNDIEKLYLYLQLPDGGNHHPNSVNDVGDETPSSNGKKKTLNNSPFGKKADSEVIQTYAWIQSHLEEDISVSIPKHEVYEEYRAYCEANHFEKLCVADFGKAMKHIFPQVKPRRLGQRGNSKYCYSGLRKKIIVTAPELPILEISNDSRNGNGECHESSINSVRKNNVMVNDVVWNIILEWVEKTFNRKFKTSIDFARYLIETQNIKSDLDTVLSSNGNCFPSSNSTITEPKSINDSTETSTNKLTNGQKISLSPIGLKIKSIMNDKKKYSSETLSTQQQIITNSNINAINSSKISTNNTASTITANTTGTIIHSTINGNSFTTLQSPKNNAVETKVVPANIPKMVPVCNAKTVKILLSPHPQNQQQQQPLPISTLQTVPSHTCFMIDQQQQQQLINASNSIESFKYKPIQSKSVNFDSMSRFRPMTSNVPSTIAFIHNEQLNSTKNEMPTTTTVALFNCNAVNVNNDNKVNDSIFKSEPYEDNNNNNNNITSHSKLTDKNHKRQIDNVEKEITVMFASKKRHVETKTTNSDNMEPKLSTITATDICDLKVNELETEALNEYLNNISSDPVIDNIQLQQQSQNKQPNQNIKNVNSENIVHIRRLLENHLAKVVPENQSASHYYSNNNNNNNQTLQNNNRNLLQNLLTNSANIDPEYMPKHQSSNLVNNSQQQLCSPNSRRNAFIFQPISPRNTPTIPENSTLEMNIFSNNNVGTNITSIPATSQHKHIQTGSVSISAGPSQPSSEANSPFVSPRNTPVSLPRSRNNSGQSAYSAYGAASQRQTPASLQNFDSGVSSISSSPFISPQSTPIPTTSLQRINQNQCNNLRNVSAQAVRVRHSSGPGGPITNRTQLASLMNYNRSNSLSPMVISDNCFGQQSLVNNSNNLPSSSSSFNFSDNTSSKLLSDDLNQPFVGHNFSSVVTQTDPTFSINQNKNHPNNHHSLSSDLFINSSFHHPQQQSTNSSRQRHFSNPYGGVSTFSSSSTVNKNNNNDDFLTNSSLSMPTTDDFLSKSLFNRSQSVPLHPNMFDASNTFDSIITDGSADECFKSTNEFIPNIQLPQQNQPSNSLMMTNNHMSKSYPATPICTDMNFKFSNNNQLANNNLVQINDDILQSTLDDLLSNNDQDVIQSGQDLIVSSVQPGVGGGSLPTNGNSIDDCSSPSLMNKETNGIINNNGGNVHGVNSGGDCGTSGVFNDDLLIDDTEQFQTLDAFHDCDNDFTNIDLVDQNVVATYGGDNDFTV
uniref:RFX-type winged-helix domain-containing protein n=1 Tax=Dermatophagoides pteronyssinus TaxID=6956 RepID=A0A6P6YJV8_DERPT|nr:putative uncharacterized protein DDB_G0282133 isoform X2 [Dermatophagoides pteronyssinus]